MGGAEEIDGRTGMVRCLGWAIDGVVFPAMTGERYDIRTRTGMPQGVRRKVLSGGGKTPAGAAMASLRDAHCVHQADDCRCRRLEMWEVFVKKCQRRRSGMAADSADVTTRIPFRRRIKAIR